MTGATGTMGSAAMHYMLAHPDRIELTVLVRDGKRHSEARKRIEKFEEEGRLKVLHGDLCDFESIKKVFWKRTMCFMWEVWSRLTPTIILKRPGASIWGACST